MAKRIVVVGAGAVGGYVGGSLAAAGNDVLFVDFWHEHIEAIRKNGLELSNMDEPGARRVKVDAIHFHEASTVLNKRPADIAIVSVKSYDTEWVATMIRPYLAPGGFVVSLQNCLNEETIAGVVGWGRTVGCIVSRISVALFEPGRIRRTAPKGKPGHTVFKFGEVHGRTTARVQELADLCSAIDSSAVTNNLWGERWSKLSQNSMRGGLAAATGLNSKGIDGIDKLRHIAVRIGAEASVVGKAHGFLFEKVDTVNSDLFARALADPAAFAEVDQLMIAKQKAETRSELQRPSMGQDMLKGRRTEIDFMNGFIIGKGREAGIPCPANEQVLKVVKRIERGELTPSPDNF